MKQEFKKKINVATCQHCGRITDITTCSAMNGMRVENQALQEEIHETAQLLNRARRMKTGQVLVLHVLIKKLYELMSPEQRAKAAQHSQLLRDEIKKIEKEHKIQ